MKFKLIVLGKNNENFINDGCEIYIKRIKQYYPFEFEVLSVKERSNKPDLIKKKESEVILREMEKGDFNILLDEKGKSYNSLRFSAFIEQQLNLSRKKIQFFIGGAYGFAPEVYNKADSKLSLSEMTFSHQIIRIIFLEQLYRAISIIHHLPYHNP